MQKRLFGILASITVIAAACGGASTTSAPPASTAPGASTPAETPVPSVSDLADEQILHIDLGQEPPTLDPNKGRTRRRSPSSTASTAVSSTSTRT